jgi:hypothetical protein
MKFQGAEDRLNPIAPADADEATLGGYQAVHGRAVAFEGADGRPYTAAIEVEQGGAGDGSWVGYLVFLRWADTGTAVMGHMETEDLVEGGTEQEVRDRLAELPLAAVRRHLDEAIRRAHPGAEPEA